MCVRSAAIVVLAALLALARPSAGSGSVFPDSTWGTRTPAEVGLDVVKLDELATLVGGSGVIVRYGYRVYTWGNPKQKYDWGSASKGMVSTLLFFADQDGLCTINSAVGDFLSGGSPKDSSITFFDLANMTSGYSRAEWPGLAWAYNDHAINLYAYTLCYQVFGTSPQSVFDARFAFLQMQDSPTIDGATQYGRIKQMSSRDFARLGLFWLNRGHWDGTQPIASSYFDTWIVNQVPPSLPRTTADGPESWSLGTNGGGDDQTRNLQGHYGMNFYVNTNGWWPGLSSNIFQANGHDGQEVCTIIPDFEIVAAGAGGDWGNPSTAAIQLLHDALLTTPVDGSPTWGGIKAGYRK